MDASVWVVAVFGLVGTGVGGGLSVWSSAMTQRQQAARAREERQQLRASTAVEAAMAELLEIQLNGEQLSRMLRAYAVANELVVVFRANRAVPSVALEAELVAGHADAVLECSPEGWIYLTDSGMLIEFRQGEGLTAWPVPR